MPRIAGVDIPRGKQILYSLQYIHGIGPTFSKRILTQVSLLSSIAFSFIFMVLRVLAMSLPGSSCPWCS